MPITGWMLTTLLAGLSALSVWMYGAPWWGVVLAPLMIFTAVLAGKASEPGGERG